MKTFNEIQQLITAELEQINLKKAPCGLYNPISYILQLGGKRIRPALTLMACNLFSENIAAAVKPAVGIEIFHNFTLLHDDIMDKADVRRGKATVHKKWNENTAILSGDGMQIIAYQYISEVETAKLKSVLDVFSQTAIEVCEGQQYDMDFESSETITVGEYFEMIRLKTAVLLGGALKIGALIGGATEEDAQLLYDFGIGIGLAFQLKDDLLDTYGDEKTFGKKIGNDILCNKKTFLLTSALEKASDEKKTELQACLQIPVEQAEEKIQSVIAIYNDLNVKAMCEEQINKFYLSAIEQLEKVQVENSRKQELKQLAEKLMFRED